MPTKPPKAPTPRPRRVAGRPAAEVRGWVFDAVAALTVRPPAARRA